MKTAIGIEIIKRELDQRKLANENHPNNLRFNEIKDEIKSLEDCLSILANQDKWISVDNMMPDEGVEVLLSCEREYKNEPNVVVGRYSSFKYWYSVQFFEDESVKITHWQPKPLPPKQ